VTVEADDHPLKSGTELIILGTAQDAGYPQIGCEKDCCKNLIANNEKGAQVTCLGVVDYDNDQIWMLEASPDFKNQCAQLSAHLAPDFKLPDGIFLTHGHIGHYTGLMYLGRESIGADQVPVYTMPKMADYLSTNGPWSQLVQLENIALKQLSSDSTIHLSDQVSITPIEVPHRGEYTETVGFKIKGENKTALFIPDIDKWHLWDRDINSEIAAVDYAFLDATFYKNGEVGNRDMSLIPHPFVEESMALFDSLHASERNKIHFIHFNHTNPLLRENSSAQTEVLDKGYRLAQDGMTMAL